MSWRDLLKLLSFIDKNFNIWLRKVNSPRLLLPILPHPPFLSYSLSSYEPYISILLSYVISSLVFILGNNSIPPNCETMILDKYLLCFDKANRLAAYRTDLPVLGRSQLRVLMAVKRWSNMRYSFLLLKISKYEPSFNSFRLTDTLKELRSLGLIESNKQLWTITPLGREYLSHIRQYLMNVRLDSR